MPASRNPTKAASKANPAPYAQDARPMRSTRMTRSSFKNTETTYEEADDDEDSSPSYNGKRAAGARELVTPEQQMALEDLFFETWGYPSLEEKTEIATRLGKSLHSTSTWFQNRRHPREELGTPRKKAWFIVKPRNGEKPQPLQGPQPFDRYSCQTIVTTLVENPSHPYAWEQSPSPSELLKLKRSAKGKRYAKGNKGLKSPATRATKAKAAFVKSCTPSPRHRSGSVASTISEANSGDSNASAGSPPPQSSVADVGSTTAEATAFREQLAAYALMDLTRLSPVLAVEDQPIQYGSNTSSFGPIRSHTSPRPAKRASPYARVMLTTDHIPNVEINASNQWSVSLGSNTQDPSAPKSAVGVHSTVVLPMTPSQSQATPVYSSTTSQNNVVSTLSPDIDTSQSRSMVSSTSLETSPTTAYDLSTPYAWMSATSYPNRDRNLALTPWIRPITAQSSESNVRNQASDNEDDEESDDTTDEEDAAYFSRDVGKQRQATSSLQPALVQNVPPRESTAFLGQPDCPPGCLCTMADPPINPRLQALRGF